MGTGGSRFGAGRPGWRRKCEHLLALDVRVLARRGRLTPGMSYSWAWTRGGHPAGNIGIQTASDHVRLAYTWTPSGSDLQQVDCSVRLERKPCHLGGTRPWFRCPRCWSLRAVIYGVASDGKFGCRRCMRLGYASEAESRIDRINRKLHKLQAKLGEEGEKSKWMRWRTFDRICARIDAADAAWGLMVLARLGPDGAM
jgi:hypothetical protein